MSREIKNPLLREAILIANPGYFELDADAQDSYGVALPERDSFLIDQYLYQHLFGKKAATQDELDEIYKNLSEEQKTLDNEISLSLVGIGEDYFYLNESLDDKTILDFETLYDYDYDYYLFQQEAGKEDIPGFQEYPYQGELYLSWGRYLANDKIVYATLTMAAGYIFCKVDSHGQDHMSKLVPHEFIFPERDEGEGSGFRLNAYGREAQYDALNMRFQQYLRDLWGRVKTEWENKNLGKTCILDTSHDGETNLHYIFTDPEALKQIRFRHFVADSKKIEMSPEPIFAQIEREKEAAVKWLDEQMADVEKIFNATPSLDNC